MKLTKIEDGQTFELFEDYAEKIGLTNYMNIFYYGIEKQKQVAKVSKLSLVGEAVANAPGSIVITIVEKIFERLSPNQQQMIVEDVFSQVSFDSEKDKITIEQPQLQMTIGAWRKYGKDLADAYEVCALTTQQMEEEKRREKEDAREAKRQAKESKKQGY